MKTITLLVASILLTTGLANAQEGRNFNTSVSTSTNFNEPFSFIERDIEFFVFANGDFDFNTRPNDVHGDYFYRSAGKKGANETVSRGNNGNYGTLIEQDSFGRVRRVGNTFINYDSQDRVSRIGSIYMKYNRFALVQIGGMKLIYNRQGTLVSTIGNIKDRYRAGYAYKNYNYNSNYNNNGNYGYNNGNYYYKTDNTKEKIELRK